MSNLTLKQMSNLTLKQLRSDFEYLEDNLSDYAVCEDGLVNHVSKALLYGHIDLKDFILWHINDIITYVTEDIEEDSDIEFLKTNKRAIRILERYNISID